MVMKNFIYYLNLLFLLAFFNIAFCEQAYQKKIIFLGDSLSEGYGISKEDSFPSIIDREFKKQNLNIEIINAGISGSTTSTAESRLRWLIKTKSAYVFLALGANDGLRGIDLELIQKNLLNTINLAKENNIKIFLAGMQMPPNYGKEYSESFKNIFIEVAKETNTPLLPFLLQDVAGVKDLNQGDGIHPNEEGHKIIARNVLKFLKENNLF